MKLYNLKLVKFNAQELRSVNGGSHVPANDWGHFKRGIGNIIHNIGDFIEGVYSGLGKS